MASKKVSLTRKEIAFLIDALEALKKTGPSSKRLEVMLFKLWRELYASYRE